MNITPLKKKRTFTVIGMNNFGKTIFLTSLIHQLIQNTLHTKPVVSGCEKDENSGSFSSNPYLEGIADQRHTCIPEVLFGGSCE